MCFHRTFAALAEDPKFHLQHTFQPGEIEIISNQVVLHSRGDVYDGEVRYTEKLFKKRLNCQTDSRLHRGIRWPLPNHVLCLYIVSQFATACTSSCMAVLKSSFSLSLSSSPLCKRLAEGSGRDLSDSTRSDRHQRRRGICCAGGLPSPRRGTLGRFLFFQPLHGLLPSFLTASLGMTSLEL